MEFHLNLEKFRMKYGRMGVESFKEAHRNPLVAFELGGEALSVKDFDSYAATAASGEPTQQKKLEGSSLEHIFVAPLVKSDRNEFGDKILVGRSPVNDVVVAHPSVSKLHAFFEKDPQTGNLLVFDGESKFGTMLNERMLESGIGSTVKSGDVLVLAGHVCMFVFSPGKFFEYMQEMARKDRAQ
jgi:hypothetical protein